MKQKISLRTEIHIILLDVRLKENEDFSLYKSDVKVSQMLEKLLCGLFRAVRQVSEEKTSFPISENAFSSLNVDGK